MNNSKKEITLIKELPEDERPREKLLRQGVESLSNAELLSILIRTGTKEACIEWQTAFYLLKNQASPILLDVYRRSL